MTPGALDTGTPVINQLSGLKSWKCPCQNWSFTPGRVRTAGYQALACCPMMLCQ